MKMGRGYKLSFLIHTAIITGFLISIPSTDRKQDDPIQISVDMQSMIDEYTRDLAYAGEAVEEDIAEEQQNPIEEETIQTPEVEDFIEFIEESPVITNMPDDAPVASFDASAATSNASISNQTPTEEARMPPPPPSRPTNLALPPIEAPPAPRTVRRETREDNPRTEAREIPPTPPQTRPDDDRRRLSQVANNRNEREAHESLDNRRQQERRQAEIAQIVVGALQRHAASCWVVPTGIPSIEDMTVTISVRLDRQKNITSVEANQTGRYHTDSFYRQFVDSAVRSFQRAGCDTLPVPDDGYEIWRNLEFDFHGSGIR